MSLLKKLRPLVLTAGLAGLTSGCSDSYSVINKSDTVIVRVTHYSTQTSLYGSVDGSLDRKEEVVYLRPFYALHFKPPITPEDRLLFSRLVSKTKH